MNFLEAINELNAGKKIKRQKFSGILYLYKEDEQICYVISSYFSGLLLEDFLATDWEITE